MQSKDGVRYATTAQKRSMNRPSALSSPPPCKRQRVNEQPWTFTVLRDQSLLDRVSTDAKSYQLANLSANSHSDHFRSMLSDPNFHIFYHAPALILISVRTEGSWIVEDCALRPRI